MSVHNAVDTLAAMKDDTPSVAAFAAQVRGLGESEAVLSQQLARAQDYITSTGRAVDMAEQNIGTALASLSEPRLSSSPEVLASAIGLVSAADWLQQLETLLRDLEAPVAATLRVNSTPWWR